MGKPAVNDLRSGLATAPTLYAAEEFPELLPLIQRRFKEVRVRGAAWVCPLCAACLHAPAWCALGLLAQLAVPRFAGCSKGGGSDADHPLGGGANC